MSITPTGLWFGPAKMGRKTSTEAGPGPPWTPVPALTRASSATDSPLAASIACTWGCWVDPDSLSE